SICHTSLLFVIPPPPHSSTLFPYTTLFRSRQLASPTASHFGRLTPRAVNGRSGGSTAATRTALSIRRLRAASRTASASSMRTARSEEHTSELQSQSNLVCRLLLEKKKNTKT